MSIKSNQWKEVILENHVDLLTGFPFKSQLFTDNKEDIPLVKGSNVHQGYIDWKDAKRWQFSDFNKYNKFQLEVGDVILAMDRPWIEAGLKYSWIRRNDPPSLLVQRVSRIRGINGLSTSYLRYLIGSSDFTDYIKPIATGINVPHISPDQIRRFKFLLPPLSTQQKIVGILSAYDDLIENNTRRIEILEEMARMLYREWFIKFRFPGHEAVQFVESELGLIPESWEVVKATDALFVNPKIKVPKEGEKPFVSMGCLSNNLMLINDIESRSGNSGSKFQNDDVLFARITPCLENGKTGYVKFLKSSDDVAFGSTEFIVLRSKTLCPEYVYLMARSDTFRDNAIKSMSGATGRQRVKEACFDQFLFAHPPSKLLNNFSKIVSSYFRLIYNLNQKNINLRKTRDLLLPRLISGEIDVENLAINTGIQP